MPRNTCRPSECNGTGDKDGTGQDEGSTASGTADEAAASAVSIVKQEFDAAPPVCHRKSERRKFARDIFLVFEEQTTRRRRGKGGARGKSRTLAKQKFGHLSVANTPRVNKNILREIKTEPKCSQASAATQVEETPALVTQLAVPAAPEVEQVADAEHEPEQEARLEEAEPEQEAELVRVQELERQREPLFVPLPLPLSPEPEKPKAKLATVKLETKTVAEASPGAVPVPVPAPAPTSLAELSAENAAGAVRAGSNEVGAGEAAARAGAKAGAKTSSTSPVAKPSVNPIFLWVKQDDTRIVEVRCEDYDKRNRIRLTKTTNGWRSMPRTDASSSRIVKFFHSAAAPLMKVKREQLQQQQSIEQELDEVEQERDEEEQDDQHQHQEVEQPMMNDWSQQTPNPNLIEDVVVVVPAQQQQEQQQADVCFDALLDSETNGSTKATKTSTSNANTPTYQCSSSDASSSSPSLVSPAESTSPPSPPPPPLPSPLELQLCPKTGLFLPKGVVAPQVVAVMPAETLEEEEVHQREEHTGKAGNLCADHSSLDANTKNLKDLLDDADDLLQNCSSDNGSSGAELLDSLVKRSCEDNLSAEAAGGGTGAGNNGTNGNGSVVAGLSSFCVPDVVAGKELPSILGMDSSDDAPKCLSFNEAGEIEGLHGDLFLNLDSFEKQPEEEEEVEVEPDQVTDTVLPSEKAPSRAESSLVVVVPDETPKDLSYKKREEVCPPSESRSQCAVTSSSDVLKSKSPDPDQLQLPASNIPAEVETTSETIKHLILEQFLKLNGGNPQQQAEPMDLGKAAAAAATVVIDDDDEEERERDRDSVETAEPLKKRPKPPIKMDKDPDALTQLKMLISNPQWKVPDPILVPKDRLGAVLASPAREIPLLLTTRPELRLPEAFAYPEIIQNPNILVVTMEQLEAILKNDAEQAKGGEKLPSVAATPPSQPLPSPASKQAAIASLTPKIHGATASSAAATSKPHLQQLPVKSPATTPTVAAAAPSPAAAAPPPPLPPTPAADSSMMSSELNATTLALLQQMLWLPYFGQLSQEFFKTLKDPLGLQRKFMSNLLPLYQSQFGLQHLDELYKHCLKQKSSQGGEATVPTAPAPAPAKQAAPPSLSGFSNPMELAFMQQLLQQQQQQQVQTKESSSSSSSSSHHHLEHKRARRDADATSLHIPDFNRQSNKSATVAAPTATPPATPTPTPTPTPAAEHKPRLTCKSLSNLLEPESNAVQLLNVPYRAGRTLPQQQQHELNKEPSGRTLRSSKACVTYNPLEQAKQSQQSHQQRKRGNMLLAHELQQQQHQQQQHQQQQQQQQQHQQQQQQHLAEAAAAAAAAAATGGNMDANAALWHPLFGSNPKQGYNSPWQWTTVTATGE